MPEKVLSVHESSGGAWLFEHASNLLAHLSNGIPFAFVVGNEAGRPASIMWDVPTALGQHEMPASVLK